MKYNKTLQLMTVLISLAASGCAVKAMISGKSNGNGSSSSVGGCAESESVTVSAAYPNNGANWLDFVENTESTYYGASDAACDGDTAIDGGSRNGEIAGVSACLHGGEIRKFQVAGKSDCTGLSATDGLDAFNWFCVDQGATIAFYSHGLKTTKGLQDLLTAAGTGWRTNTVTVTDGTCTVAESTAAAWWTNPVRNLNHASLDNVTLGATGVTGVVAVTNTNTTGGGTAEVDTYRMDDSAIYTVTASRSLAGIALYAQKSAVVVYQGARLTRADSGNANCSSGNIGAVDKCFVFSTQRYTWVEGQFRATDQYDQVVSHYSNSFGTVRRYQASGDPCCSTGVYLNSASNFRLSQIRLNRLGNGVYLELSSYIVVNDVVVSSPDTGVRLWLTTDSVFEGILVNGSNGNAFGILNSPRLVFHNVTGINNVTAGFNMGNGGSTHLISAILANNAASAISLSGGSQSYLAQLALTENGSYGISLGTSTNNDTRGNIVFGNNNGGGAGFDCSNPSAGNDFGAGSTACTDAGANFTRVPGATLAGSFVGQVLNGGDSVNDNIAANALNGSGYLAFASVTDYFDFDFFHRAWNLATSQTPLASGNRGRCNTGTNCSVFDWRLSSADPNGILNINGAFTNGAACPASSHGSESVTDLITGAADTFLTNASEIRDDGIGDNDGLCEDNEACIYSPNIGAYQGHGSLGSCTFNANGGNVTGVTMYGYLTNGG
jgi:hypothetical protein